jgi:hypothetical protein
LEAHPEVTLHEQKEAVKVLVKRIPDSPVNWRGILLLPLEGSIPKLTTVNKFRFVWLAQLKRCRKMIEAVSLFGATCTYLPASRQITTTSKKEEPSLFLMTLSRTCVTVVVVQVMLPLLATLRTPSISIQEVSKYALVPESLRFLGLIWK